MCYGPGRHRIPVLIARDPMPVTRFDVAYRAHALHAAAACARVKPGVPLRCPLPAALETFGFPAVPMLAVREIQGTLDLS